jgi:hypothetical protein
MQRVCQQFSEICLVAKTIDVPEQISLGIPNEALGSYRNRIEEPMAYRVGAEYHLLRSESKLLKQWLMRGVK